MSRRLNRLQCSETLGGRYFLAHRVNVAGDDHQKIIEVMGYAACELAQRIKLLRFSKLLLHQIQSLFSLLSLGDITRNLCETNQFVGVVSNSVDDNARPKE